MTVRVANTPEKAQVIVKRGVRLLDASCSEWWKKINLSKFDLGDKSRCVLGYVYRDFFVGLNKLFVDAKKAGVKDIRKMKSKWNWDGVKIAEYYYGFNYATNKHGEYLSQQWRRVIARRQRRQQDDV